MKNLLIITTIFVLCAGTMPSCGQTNGIETFIANGVSFDMVAVQGGTLRVSADFVENLQSKNTSISVGDFMIGKTEVTQGLWQAVMGKSLDWDSEYGKGANYPVYNVLWNDIVGTPAAKEGYTIDGVTYYQNGFCYKLSARVNNGKQFALPSAGEWLWAYKGGNKSKGYKYSGSNIISEVAVDCSRNMPGEGYDGYHLFPVATKKANELGLYDMTGNVYEILSDRHECTTTHSETSCLWLNIGGGAMRYEGEQFNIPQRSGSTIMNGYPITNEVPIEGFRIVCK